MGFKIIKEPQQQQKFCDYIQNKLDIAQQFNARYELVDQDIRIQKLYDDNTLKPVEKIKSIARVKKLEDGKECLVVSKEVAFIDKLTGIKKDSYIDCEGLTELPLKVTNEDGATETSQVKLEYDIPFSKAKAMEYIRKAGDMNVEMRFYDGPETGNRAPTRIQMVGNTKYFTDATWEELLLGREMGVVHSRINRLEDVRKNIPNQHETNKLEKDTNTILEKREQIPQEQEQTGLQLPPPTSTPSGTVKLKVSKTTTKQN